MNTYILLDGTRLTLRDLEPSEKTFLRGLMRMASQDISYFDIYRTALGPGSVAMGGRIQINSRITHSPLYLAARDIATRAGIEQGLILAPEHESKRAQFPTDGSHISATQASNLIGISRAAVYKAIENDKLDILKIGNVTLVSKKSALAYRANREKEAARPKEPSLAAHPA